MTTLVAIQGDGWSVIGCDSRSSDESGRYLEMATHKVVENNGILIAGSGAGRGSNILQFGWRAPRPKAGQNLDVFMTKTFIPSMRKVFIESGYDMKADGEAAAHDSEFIVSIHGVLYPIYEDYSWDREESNVYHSGSGSDLALGVLEALNYQKCKNVKEAEKIVYRAVEIAIKHDIYSGGNVHTFIQEE